MTPVTCAPQTLCHRRPLGRRVPDHLDCLRSSIARRSAGFAGHAQRAELERIGAEGVDGHSETLHCRRGRRLGGAAGLARAELALGLHSEAGHHFQTCLKGRPDDVRCWRDFLTMLLEQGDLEAFLALLERAPASAESEPETWMFRGSPARRPRTGRPPRGTSTRRSSLIQPNPNTSIDWPWPSMPRPARAGQHASSAVERDERGPGSTAGRLRGVYHRIAEERFRRRISRPHASTSGRSARRWAGFALRRPGTDWQPLHDTCPERNDTRGPPQTRSCSFDEENNRRATAPVSGRTATLMR